MLVFQETCGPDLPEFPTDLKIDITVVYLHPSGMVATHNYPCPVCLSKPAVFNMSTGHMNPCRSCEKDYVLIKKADLPKTFWQQLKLFFKGKRKY